MPLNPDKYIRKLYLSIPLTIGSVSVPIYVDEVPLSVNPIPTLRVIITTQTKQGGGYTNCGHTWECSILLDIISEERLGFINRTAVDDIEEQISNFIDIWSATGTEVQIPPFVCNFTRIADTHNQSFNTESTTIIRKLVRYEHRLSAPQ